MLCGHVWAKVSLFCFLPYNRAMSTPILATKLYLPPPRPKVVTRPRLIERLNEGLHHKLTLISAPAGFGKTTLISEWIAGCGQPTAWLSLDESDNDPIRFLTYFVAALQTLAPNIGKEAPGLLRSSQPPPLEALLTDLLNEIATIPNDFVLVLDDYHAIDTKAIDESLSFLLKHLPPTMHLFIATREDPQLPLSRLRARNQLTELRIADLRFTPSEAAGFLNQVMGLHLSAEDIAALETRTEGWIAGLQLAAISMQGHRDVSGFIKSFTGSHHFVLDYLAEEVLQQQPEPIQNFLLRTSILDRMCGPLCDALLDDPRVSGQVTLEQIEHANLFIIPLDNERRWYRYHRLFGDLLRQRLQQQSVSAAGNEMAELHLRASAWYEDNGLEFEAFYHAAAANDVERTERLIAGKGMPLQFRGAVFPVLNWLKSLPTSVLDARPSLWVTYASALSMAGQTISTEQKLQAAEAALQGASLDAKTRNLIGHIAAIRAVLALSQHDVATIIFESNRALEYLHPDNVPVRTATIWKLGYAYQIQGDRVAASRAYAEAIATAEASGNLSIMIAASIGLGMIQQSDNHLALAVQSFRHCLQLYGDQPLPIACEAHLGLARIFYEWNDLEAARQHGQQSVQYAQRLQHTDRLIACQIFLARLKLVEDDLTGAAAILAEAAQFARQNNFMGRMPDVVAAQVLTLLQQGNLAAAAQLAQTQALPLAQARVLLAQGDTFAALAILVPVRQQADTRHWADEQLKVAVLQGVTLWAHGDKSQALQALSDALMLAEPGGFIRTFVDEGVPMSQLLIEAATYGIMPDYIGKLLAIFDAEAQQRSGIPSAPSLDEPLSQRELEVLHLIAQGLSNREISERLFLALSTVKGHNQIIFDKLHVQRRTEAVVRARELGLL